MEGWLSFIDRFRTPITVVLVVAILTAGALLYLRSSQLAALLNDRDDAVAESDELKTLQQRQQQLLAELERLRTEDQADQAGDPAATAPPSTAPTGSASASSSAPAGLVHLNSANQAALETLTGIGASKAQAILDYRAAHGRFSSLDELDNVKGIGPATVAKLKPYLALD